MVGKHDTVASFTGWLQDEWVGANIAAEYHQEQAQNELALVYNQRAAVYARVLYEVTQERRWLDLAAGL